MRTKIEFITNFIHITNHWNLILRVNDSSKAYINFAVTEIAFHSSRIYILNKLWAPFWLITYILWLLILFHLVLLTLFHFIIIAILLIHLNVGINIDAKSLQCCLTSWWGSNLSWVVFLLCVLFLLFFIYEK